MAYSLNKVQLIGNLTKDPELKTITSGQAVASFSVATNSSWVDKAGQKQEKSEFHNVVAWGKLAEICGSYMKKGKKVYIEGRLQTRDWEGEDGVKKYRTEIVADNVILLDRAGSPAGGGDDEVSAAPMQRAQRPVKAQAESAPQEEVSIDDLPF